MLAWRQHVIFGARPRRGGRAICETGSSHQTFRRHSEGASARKGGTLCIPPTVRHLVTGTAYSGTRSRHCTYTDRMVNTVVRTASLEGALLATTLNILVDYCTRVLCCVVLRPTSHSGRSAGYAQARHGT